MFRSMLSFLVNVTAIYNRTEITLQTFTALSSLHASTKALSVKS